MQEVKPEAGKRYVCRDGVISGVIHKNADLRRPYRDGEIQYTREGRMHLDDTEDGRDLVQEV